jgi:hypothetical protein
MTEERGLRYFSQPITDGETGDDIGAIHSTLQEQGGHTYLTRLILPDAGLQLRQMEEIPTTVAVTQQDILSLNEKQELPPHILMLILDLSRVTKEEFFGTPKGFVMNDTDHQKWRNQMMIVFERMREFFPPRVFLLLLTNDKLFNLTLRGWLAKSIAQQDFFENPQDLGKRLVQKFPHVSFHHIIDMLASGGNEAQTLG